MPCPRARRPSTRPERWPRTPCLPKTNSRYPCPSRGGPAAAGTRAGDRGDPRGPQGSFDGAHWRGRALVDTRARGTRRRSRSVPDRASGRHRRRRRTTRTTAAKELPAKRPLLERTSRNELGHLEPIERDNESVEVPLSTGRLGVRRAFRFFVMRDSAWPRLYPEAIRGADFPAPPASTPAS